MRIATRKNTSAYPRSRLAVPAHRLATTEQSVVISCTRSILIGVPVGSWPLSFRGDVACIREMISFRRSQPLKTFNWRSENWKSKVSLLLSEIARGIHWKSAKPHSYSHTQISVVLRVAQTLKPLEAISIAETLCHGALILQAR